MEDGMARVPSNAGVPRTAWRLKLHSRIEGLLMRVCGGGGDDEFYSLA